MTQSFARRRWGRQARCALTAVVCSCFPGAFPACVSPYEVDDAEWERRACNFGRARCEDSGGAAGAPGAGGDSSGGTGTVEPASCFGQAPSCGVGGDRDCCASIAVDGGSFNRSGGQSWPATVSTFRLDRYEVTVARFRQFKTAWATGWRPRAGDGKHVHLRDGLGLAAVGSSGYEAGWLDEWAQFVDLADSVRTCHPSLASWTTEPGMNEWRPVNCVNWYEAFAFCAWDGGFLPSEAEWNYAAAGGSESREYPWSVPPESRDVDCRRASYRCSYLPCGDGQIGCAIGDLLEVGSTPLGDGRWGHAELAGNVREWTADGYANPYPSLPSLDGAVAQPHTSRAVRGGSFSGGDASYLLASTRDSADPASRMPSLGIRCARSP